MEPFAEEEPACGRSGRLCGKRIHTYRQPGSFRGADIANAELLGVISYRFIS